MADTMQVELVSPEKKLASLEAEAVVLPGADGDFTAMPGHVPVVTSLRPGIIHVRNGSTETEYLIAGGFAEVSGSSISILAEFAALRSEAKAEMFEASLASAEASLEGLDKEALAEANRRVGSIKSMMAGLS